MTEPSVRAWVERGAALLRAAGVASPEYDATTLLAHVLGLTRGELAVRAASPVAQSAEFLALVERRASRVPLQHLTGVASFRHVDLAVGPGVFVPRPETELLAGWAVEAAASLPDPVVVDLCTGSGAIALAIADEVPQAKVYAVEVDEQALEWAGRNLAGTGIELTPGDLADALPELRGTVDVVVCNPPYIPKEAWESVAPEARDHDPHLALFSGDDGLVAMRALERRAAYLLKIGGVVGAEHAEVQHDSAPAVFTAAHRWSHVRDHYDLAGCPRFLSARLAR